jgi:bacteriocin-like protein
MEKKDKQETEKVKQLTLEQLQTVSGGRRGRGPGRGPN